MSDKIIRVTISIDYQNYKYGDTVFLRLTPTQRLIALSRCSVRI